MGRGRTRGRPVECGLYVRKGAGEEKCHWKRLMEGGG